MSDTQHIKILNDKIELMKNLISNGSISYNWVINEILEFEQKSEYRKEKIKRVFNNG